jgi:hypothetical protein
MGIEADKVSGDRRGMGGRGESFGVQSNSN